MEDLKNDFNILGGINVTEHNKDDEVIQRISTATGVVYSDEQLNILKHHGGMAIMAAAGSGKTTVLTHLITKRILSGEIQDTSKVICTTYSKAGADEMEERINKLLSIVGIKQRIMVKTMHALYLLILQHFGYSMKLVDNLQRTRFIKEACTKAGVKLNDEDLQTLDSLLSYQVNNLLSDKDLYNSYVYNLSTVSIEKYNQIHGWYTQLKKQANMMDFDDMQLYVYFWLCVADENTRTAVTKYIQQNWTDFYIDEAQDISRIQMAILRKMCTDSNKVVFIGDDDQCLVKGTKVSTPNGLVNIEDIKEGDLVYVGNGESGLCEEDVYHTSKKMYSGQVVVVRTSSGKVIKATPDHLGFARLVPNENNFYTYLMYKNGVGYRIGTTSGVRAGARQEIANGIDARVMQERADKAWLIRKSDSREESLFWEAFFAYKYSIPMYRFLASDSKWNKTSLRQEQINRLFKALNTEESAKKLLSDLGMMFEYPHRVPQAEGDRCKLSYSLLSSIQVDKNGVHKSEISANSSNQAYVEILRRYLATIERKSKTKYNYFNSRSTTSNLIHQDEVVKNIVNDCKDAGIYLEVDRNIKLGDKKYQEINMGNIIEGMYVPVENNDGTISEEEVVQVTREEYNDYVYDISVPSTRNFVANGVIVHNCIYEWRGADPSLLINITGYYDIQKFILSTNYRCRAEIVDTAAVGIKFNNRRSMKDMTPFHSGGSIKVIDTTKHKVDGSSEAPDIYHMSKYAFMYIRKIISDGINPADIAVLSRNNNQLVILNNMLFRDGIYCSFSKDMRFTGNGMYKELKQILELAKDEYNHKLTSNLLWKVVPYFSVKSAKVLADFQEKCYMRFSDMLGYFLTECCNMQLDWKMPAGIKIPETYKARLKALARQLNSSQASNLKVMYLATVYSGSKETNIDKAKKENEYRRISNYLGLYTQVSVDFLYRTEDKQRTCIGYIEYFKTMVKDWGIEKTLRFLNVTQQYESGLITAFTEKVNMSTMHGAKGKEWSHVVLFADDNITFPCFRSFVDLQKRGTSKADIYKVIEEDRRLHYVAMTRAKNELAVVTYADNISVYTLEAFEILKGLDNNELIYDMAMTNRVRADFINKAKNKLLDINSKYHIDIDISKISEAPEIEFGTNDDKRDNDNSCGFSLDDMIGVAIDTEQPQEVENNSNVSIDNIGTTLNITSDTDDYNYTDEL